jgi:signal transduction histidine kinase
MSTDVAPLTLGELRTIDLFDDLDDVALGEFLAVARPRTLQPGDIFARAGEKVPGVHLLLAGSARSTMYDEGRAEPVGRQLAPTWAGAIATMTDAPLLVQMEAESVMRVALIAGDDFRRLAFAHPGVHRRVMQAVAPVMTRLTAIEHSRERLASLGTMAAGLAHELNNPAAAARSAAGQLVEALDTVSATLGRFVDSGIEREQAGALVALHEETLKAAAEHPPLSGLDAADAEDALLERLEDLGVPEPWRVAEPLAAAGLDAVWLDRVAALAGPATAAALGWIGASLTARGLAAELQESTARMSGLVTAVKSYAYMDRGGIVEVDLHEGLETTLTVLGHKLRHTSIRIERDYDRTLPKLTVRGSELNQVWTNLIHNALDALGDAGTITIRTHQDGSCAMVDVLDDGPGIPEDVRDHVFDSFFTTKDVGAGTGLGLATARSIVVDRHGGSMLVESEPGRTMFRVSLPLVRRG